MNKKANLNVLGAIFFIWGFVAIIENIFKADEGIAPVLWMSYICLIVISIGVLKRDAGLIASQLAIIFFPYILWNIDFFHQLFTGNNLLGIVEYFFQPGSIISKTISLQHIFNIPLSLYAIHLIGLKNSNFWKISLFQITLVFIASRLVTNYDQNVNCVYKNCANFDFGLPYIIEWFLANIIMISITSWFLVKIFKKNNQEKIKK